MVEQMVWLVVVAESVGASLFNIQYVHIFLLLFLLLFFASIQLIVWNVVQRNVGWICPRCTTNKQSRSFLFYYIIFFSFWLKHKQHFKQNTLNKSKIKMQYLVVLFYVFLNWFTQELTPLFFLVSYSVIQPVRYLVIYSISPFSLFTRLPSFCPVNLYGISFSLPSICLFI